VSCFATRTTARARGDITAARNINVSSKECGPCSADQFIGDYNKPFQPVRLLFYNNAALAQKMRIYGMQCRQDVVEEKTHHAENNTRLQ